MSKLTGTVELRRVARLLKDGDKALRKELNSAIRKPVKRFTAQVREEVPSAVPGGYAPILAGALRVSIGSALVGSGAGYTLTISAKGAKEKRDVKAINAGILRHPVYGHRDTWVAQHVRGGFVDRAAEKFGNEVAREVEEAVSRVAEKIENG